VNNSTCKPKKKCPLLEVMHVSLGILWSVILITLMQSISKFLDQNGILKKN